MRFKVNKQRQTPPIIIVALVDVLIVVLIFLVVTTHPAFKMTLPESETAQQGSTTVTNIIINVPKGTNVFFVGADVYSDIQLLEYLSERARVAPNIAVSIRADTESAFGRIVALVDILKKANILHFSAFAKPVPASD